MLLPFFLVLAVSTSSFTGLASVLPDAPTHFSYALEARPEFLSYFANTIVVSAATLFITICMALLANFTFHRATLAVLTALMSLTFLAQLYLPEDIMLPNYSLMHNDDLLYAYLSHIVIYVTVTLPMAIWILHGFRGKLAIWLEEAASIDGARPVRILWDIALPVSRPGTFATIAYVVVVTWKDFLLSLSFKASNFMPTLPHSLDEFHAQFGNTYTDLFSASLVVSLPVVAVFMYLKRYLVAGLNKGVLKKG